MSEATASSAGHHHAATKVVSPLAVVMLLVAAFGVVKDFQNERVIIEAEGWHIVLGAAVIWVVYGAVAVTAVVLLQRYARRPGWTIALAIIWGALAANYFAAAANTALSTLVQDRWASDATAWAATPVVEESIKAVGVVALVLVPVLRRFGPVDGLFYGVAVGAGFELFENFIYTLTAVSQSADSMWQAVWVTVVLRGFISVFSHVVWTGILGAAIGFAAAGGRPGRARRVLIAVGAYALVMVLHGLHNWLALNNKPQFSIPLDLIGLAILVTVLLRLQRKEKARLTALAVDNGGWGVLDPATLVAPDRGRDGRKRRRHELRYAYARDQYGPDSRLTHRAHAALGRA